jgi:putative FmdB family regulatory protein
MPIYEYTCQKCKAHVEIMQKVSEKPLTRHSKCGGKLEKEWSRTGFQFKGAGWYVTDYAGKKSEAKETKSDATDTKEAKGEPSKAGDAPAKSADAKKPTKTADTPSKGTTGGD